MRHSFWINIYSGDGAEMQGNVQVTDVLGKSYTGEFKTKGGRAGYEVRLARKDVAKIRIAPLHSYWPRTELNCENLPDFVCPPISPMQGIAYRRLVSNRIPLDASGVRIGIVDKGFHENRLTAVHFERVFDSAGRELTADAYGAFDASDEIHGTTVSSLISAQFEHEHLCSISTGAALFACALPWAPGGERSYDYYSVPDAFKVLIECANVDIINFSAGMVWPSDAGELEEFDEPPDQYLREAIDIARGAGVLVVASSGNDMTLPVHMPAAYKDVVGVGGLAVCDVVQASCDLFSAEREARSRGTVYPMNGLQVFLDPESSRGPEVNLHAPSRGIAHSVLSFAPPSEFVGTSYAAPIVTGVLAAAMKEMRISRKDFINDYQGTVDKLVESVAFSLHSDPNSGPVRALHYS